MSDARPDVEVTAAGEQPAGAEVPADGVQDGRTPAETHGENAPPDQPPDSEVPVAGPGGDMPSGSEKGDPARGAQADEAPADAPVRTYLGLKVRKQGSVIT